MNQDHSQLIALLSQRYQAFRSLASEVAAGQEACIALDLEGIQIHDMRKVQLCAEVSRLDRAITGLQQSPLNEGIMRRLTDHENPTSDTMDAGTLQQIRQLWQDSEAARTEVGRRNQVYAEFLRRAGSTVNVITNVMSHCLGVYPPSFDGSAALSLERCL